MPHNPDHGYRTIGIETGIPWPTQERVIEFRGREFRLLPATDRCSRMVRVKLAPEFPQSVADQLILELLSALAWAEQAGAEATFGTWGTVPINVGKGPLGVTGGGEFDYVPDPGDPKAKLALALYREGLSVNMVPYQFLAFFKIINVIRDKGWAQKQWIRDHLQHVTDAEAKVRIAAIQATEPDVAAYLYGSGRNAVAHAFDPQTVVNPDDPVHLIRLNLDLPVIRELARVAVEMELNVKSAPDFHREHRYELEGLRAAFGDAVVERIKSGAQVPPAELPAPASMSLRLRDRDPIELFESMDAEVMYAREGKVRLRLGSRCGRLITFVTLDFAGERLIFDGLSDLHVGDDGSAEAAAAVLQRMRFHRWWFGSNGTVELWEPATNRRLGRGQPYVPPLNSWFPHEEFERTERELRERAGTVETVPTTQPR